MTGPFDGHLSAGQNVALLLVDVVMAYLDPASPFHAIAAGPAVEVNERLVAAARDRGVPVVFTQVEYLSDGADGGLFYRKVPMLSAFRAGSPFGAFAPTLRPEPGDVVVTKQYASAFFGTSLASTLRVQRIDTLLITGFSTSGCVRASAVDSLQHGFAPFVVAEACADRHSGPHAANLFDLQAKYAEVIDEGRALSIIASGRPDCGA